MVEVVWWTICTTISELLAGIILVIWVALWIIHINAIIYGCHQFHRRGPLPPQLRTDVELGEGLVGVTVLKPLVGKPMDPNLMTNLESFFNMDYPKYELRFCVAEEGDPCIMAVMRLMSKYPAVDATLHVGASNVGVNPKINNLYAGYEAARYPLVLISDSGIFMKPEVLSEMVATLTDDIGIVHQMPFTIDRKGWPATLEKVYFGGAQARMYLFLNMLDRCKLRANCLTGMSFLIRKKMIQQAGGITTFGQYLAEDYFFADYCQQHGWGIRISSFPALQNHGLYSVQSFIARTVRWTKLRIKMAPVTIIMEPLTECVLLGLLSSLSATIHFKVDFLAFFLFHLLAWILADWTLLNIVQNGPPTFSKFEFVITWLFREFGALFVYLSAYRDPEIKWRTSRFVVHWGGKAEKVTNHPSLGPSAAAVFDSSSAEQEKILSKTAAASGVSLVLQSFEGGGSKLLSCHHVLQLTDSEVMME